MVEVTNVSAWRSSPTRPSAPSHSAELSPAASTASPSSPCCAGDQPWMSWGYLMLHQGGAVCIESGSGLPTSSALTKFASRPKQRPGGLTSAPTSTKCSFEMPYLRAKSQPATITPSIPPWLDIPPVWMARTPQKGNRPVNSTSRDWS